MLHQDEECVSVLHALLLGALDNPVLDKKYLYSWIKLFDDATQQFKDVCARVAQKYESAVARYGYSLYNFKRVTPTPALRRFLLT